MAIFPDYAVFKGTLYKGDFTVSFSYSVDLFFNTLSSGLAYKNFKTLLGSYRPTNVAEGFRCGQSHFARL